MLSFKRKILAASLLYLSNSKFKTLSGVPGWLDLITDFLALRSFWYWPSDHSLFSFAPLPPFYGAVFDSRRSLGGSCDPSSRALTYSGGSISRTLLSGITCKLAYLHLLEMNAVVPHCVEKFSLSFGTLYWPATWSQLFYMPFDRVVIDLSWKIAHGVLYTAKRLSCFGYAISTTCFCNDPMESAERLFFHCSLAKSGIDWIQSQLFLAALTAPSICLRHFPAKWFSLSLCCSQRYWSLGECEGECSFSPTSLFWEVSF